MLVEKDNAEGTAQRVQCVTCLGGGDDVALLFDGTSTQKRFPVPCTTSGGGESGWNEENGAVSGAQGSEEFRKSQVIAYG